MQRDICLQLVLFQTLVHSFTKISWDWSVLLHFYCKSTSGVYPLDQVQTACSVVHVCSLKEENYIHSCEITRLINLSQKSMWCKKTTLDYSYNGSKKSIFTHNVWVFALIQAISGCCKDSQHIAKRGSTTLASFQALESLGCESNWHLILIHCSVRSAKCFGLWLAWLSCCEILSWLTGCMHL